MISIIIYYCVFKNNNIDSSRSSYVVSTNNTHFWNARLI